MAPKAAGRKARIGMSSSTGAQENVKKRPASVSAESEKNIQKKKCKSIISALAGVEELSPKVRETLAGLVSHSIGLDSGLPPQYRPAAMTMVREALASTERRLEEELREAQIRVDGAQADKVAREAAVTDAEAHLDELKKTIVDSKVTIKESNTSIGTSRKSLKTLQGVQKSSQDKLIAIAAKVEQLHNVEKDAYQPLKEAAALGRKGNEQLKCIRKLGKDFCFQEALLESVPGVLKRSLDRRRTFDGLVMNQLEREFLKHYTDLEAKLKESEEKLREHSHAVEEAQILLNESQHSLEESSQRLDKASVALSPSRKSLMEVRQHVRKFDSDMQRRVRDLTLAQGRLDAFRSGPFAAFEELQKQASALLVGACDEKQPPVPSQRSDVSPSVCETIAQPSVSHPDVSASLATTCPWQPDETSLKERLVA
jgi:DNA repair exonuclease SbcCD ATPase subunit